MIIIITTIVVMTDWWNLKGFFQVEHIFIFLDSKDAVFFVHQPCSLILFKPIHPVFVPFLPLLLVRNQIWFAIWERFPNKPVFFMDTAIKVNWFHFYFKHPFVDQLSVLLSTMLRRIVSIIFLTFPSERPNLVWSSLLSKALTGIPQNGKGFHFILKQNIPVPSKTCWRELSQLFSSPSPPREVQMGKLCHCIEADMNV